MDKVEILNIYSKNYTIPITNNIISRLASHETLESEFFENKDKNEKWLIDLTSKKNNSSVKSQKNVLIKLSNKMEMTPQNKY